MISNIIIIDTIKDWSTFKLGHWLFLSVSDSKYYDFIRLCNINSYTYCEIII